MTEPTLHFGRSGCDREGHEHGDLPDTRSGETRRLIQGWKFWPSRDALADVHVSPDDHVAVTCHCARCEADRGGVERNADGTPYYKASGEAGCANGRDTHGS